MKKIKAVVRQHRLDTVLNALHARPELASVTVSHVRGFGQVVGRTETEDAPVQFGTAEMVKLECVVDDVVIDKVIEFVQQAAHTGNVGDGKIFVFDIELAVKIRTGARLARLE